MNTFTIFPAIDLQNGNVVRLKQGDPSKAKVFDLDPVGAANKWLGQGANWLHIVNLNGAFGEDTQLNISALKAVLAAVNGSAFVQFGGGIRNLSSIDLLLSLGVSRIILGTAAVKNPSFLRDALHTFGSEKIVLGVDARNGRVSVSGWEEHTEITPLELIAKYMHEGLETVIFTNILRDGMGTGVDISSTKALSEGTGLNIIASGGVGSIEDIKAIKDAGLSGVIVGTALYENKFNLSEALVC